MRQTFPRLGPSRLTASALAIILAFLISPPAAAFEIELADVAPDRIERQRAHAAGKHDGQSTPDSGTLEQRLAAAGLTLGAPVFIRIFKKESIVEVWIRKSERFVLFSTYPICYWSGTLGPKLKEGDRQNPEGLYTVTRRQLHRSGRWPRSLNIGFPNALERAKKRTGSYILIHGGCTSVGCYAMTDEVVREIFTLSNRALLAGQPRIHVHAFPFRMTEANLAAHRSSPWYGFWRNLQEAHDAFAKTLVPPQIAYCPDRYIVEPTTELSERLEPNSGTRRRGRGARGNRWGKFPVRASCADTASQHAVPAARRPLDRTVTNAAEPTTTP